MKEFIFHLHKEILAAVKNVTGDYKLGNVFKVHG